MGNKSSTLGVIEPKIFRFNFSIDDYRFQFYVHERNPATAEVHLRQMVDLYINGYARVARAKLEAGLESKNANEIIRIADFLSGYDFSNIAVSVEENDESHYAGMYTYESALFSVFKRNGLGIVSFTLKVNDFDTYRARALSQDSNYFRSLMSKINCFNRDFHQQLPPPFCVYSDKKTSIYDPIMLKKLENRLELDYKIPEIPPSVFEYGTSYYEKKLKSYEFTLYGTKIIFSPRSTH